MWDLYGVYDLFGNGALNRRTLCFFCINTDQTNPSCLWRHEFLGSKANHTPTLLILRVNWGVQIKSSAYHAFDITPSETRYYYVITRYKDIVLRYYASLGHCCDPAARVRRMGVFDECRMHEVYRKCTTTWLSASVSDIRVVELIMIWPIFQFKSSSFCVFRWLWAFSSWLQMCFWGEQHFHNVSI